jgi:hypothetical protein
MVKGMAKPDARLRALIQTVVLLRRLAREMRRLLIEITGLLVALVTLVAVAAASRRPRKWWTLKAGPCPAE